MKLFTTVSLALLGTLLIACSPAGTTNTSQTPATATTENIVLRFAVLGDAEPKPEPQFPHLAAAVADVNQLAEQTKLDFVVGVGDIAHKGTLVQYDNATPVLQQLTLPFYPIMGNEEHVSTVERFLHFAKLWNSGKATINSPRYSLEFEQFALVLASPDFGRDFNDDGIAWLKQEITRLSPKPVLLVVHGAQQGVYQENADKGISHAGFVSEVISQPNLRAVISGDLHMDMPRVKHSLAINGVHYLHIPALERGDPPRVLVDAGHPVAEVGETGPGHQADIAGSYHGNTHGASRDERRGR